jgi:predicted DCC family thiol-disulfide oxidoreductase YuxK
MTEIILLYLFLSVAFVLAPLMTNRFFLNNSRIYSDAHRIALIVLLFSAFLNLNYLASVWPLFCAFGFLLYLKREYRFIFSAKGLASSIPFVFSLISSAWFFAGANDLHLLGYNKVWSFYAALHGSFLGWMFVGCLAFLSRRPTSNKLFLWGCYLSFVFFLFVAFGIDGIPHIKRIGVIGFSLIVPLLIGLYAFSLKKESRLSRYLSAISLLSIIAAMILAVLNEFWAAAPRVAFGIPLMVLAHGFINAILTVPCFYLAIRLEGDERQRSTTTENNIVFFDGFCVLCNSTVALLIKLDKNRVLRYSSLQGKYAQDVLNLHHIESGASVIFRSEGVSYQKAEAALHILLKLGGLFRFLGGILNLLPLFILDALYDFVARNRYRFFGKNDSCLIPKEEDKKLFLP